MFHTDGSMDPVSQCDLQLDSVGEDGNDPIDCKFNFVAGLQCHSAFCLLFLLLCIFVLVKK